MSRGKGDDFLYDKCYICPRDIEIYLSAVFFYLAAALPHHTIRKLYDVYKLRYLLIFVTNTYPAEIAVIERVFFNIVYKIFILLSQYTDRGQNLKSSLLNTLSAQIKLSRQILES